ncbi:hypothetical protein KL936_004932 [Ogataea polymorpha]|nr:hypothetical protein KL936_004932 [Ogataea polymorpha]
MRVVIVGGGVAGLKAALDLHSQGIEFVLLEARDRLGGRILTDRTGLTAYDMGASWAHDTLTNELFDEMVADGDYELYYDDMQPYLVGEHLSNDDFHRLKIEQVANEITKFVELRQFSSLDIEDKSLQDVVKEYVDKQKKLLTPEQAEYAPQFVRHLELWHGIGWEEMSSKYSLVDNVGRNCLIRSGYDHLIQKMADKLPQECLKTKQVVTRVEKSSVVVVQTADGNIYRGDYLICTVPQSLLQLSVPKAGAIEWIPPLPKTITDPLRKMGYGKLGKVVLEFEYPFWSHLEYDRFLGISSPTTTSEKCVWNNPVLILNMFYISKVPSLVCFIQGRVTEHLERNPSLAWEYFRPLLQKLGPLPLAPTNVVATSWTLDPFARGSYAACRPGDDPTDVIINLERGFGNVRFAGEHTILDGAGAVHGAWMSGKREAEYILNNL